MLKQTISDEGQNVEKPENLYMSKDSMRGMLISSKQMTNHNVY